MSAGVAAAEVVRRRRVLALLTALRWAPVGLLVPLQVLIMQSRGLSLTEVGAVAATYTVTVALLELPTGGLADAVGRRTVLVAGTLFSLAKLATFLTARSVTMFVAAWVLHGIDRALRSGPLEAWFVDTDLEVNQGRDVGRGLSRAGVAESLALGASSLVAGLLPQLVPGLAPAGGPALLTVLTVPVVAAVLLELVHLAALVWLLPGQPGRGGLAATARQALETPAAVGRGLRLLWASAEVRLLLVATAAVGVALYSVELLWQPRLARLLGDVSGQTELFGYFGAAGFAAAAAGSLLAPPLAARLRHPAWAALAGTAAYAATLVVLAGTGTPLAALGAFAATYVCLGLLGPLQRQLLHERVPSTSRATALSCESLALMLGVLATSLLLSRLAQGLGIPAAWLAAAALLLLSAACYLPLLPRRRPAGRDGGSCPTA